MPWEVGVASRRRSFSLEQDAEAHRADRTKDI